MDTTDQPALFVDLEPGTNSTGYVVNVLPFVFASAEGHRDEFGVRLYHCPIDPAEELRLTWDALRRRHAGFCKVCTKLWPLPRRVPTPEELRELADQRQMQLNPEAST